MSTQPAAMALWPGQRLTRVEFLRRWSNLPDIKRAELIDGIVYMASPVSLGHSEADFLVHTWLGAYACATPGCAGSANGTWLMLESAPQPDACLRLLPEHGGQSGTEGQFGAGAPELVAEIPGSSAAYDSGAKMALYQRAGVREYLTLSLSPPRVIWRSLRDGTYVPIEPEADGILRSNVFPGLWLDPAALLAEDGARLLAVLNQGLATPEHAAFVQRLAAT